jgi:hypothetical protein
MTEIPDSATAAAVLPKAFRPRTGTMDSWNAAYVRVEDYLKILERAARRHQAQPALDPTMIAAEETEALMDAWFAEVLDEKGEAHDRLAIDGRVSLLLCDGPERWPYAFLDEENIPVDFVEAMRSSNLQAGPDLAVSSMVPRPIDFGRITGAAGETLERFERWPALRALFLWWAFALVLAGIFYLTR